MKMKTVSAKSSQISKNPISSNNSRPSESQVVRTAERLNPSTCDRTFRNVLRARNGQPGHNETKLALVGPKYKKRREQVSHIFSQEPEHNVSHGGGVRYTYKRNASSVMFNDSYVEEHPKITLWRKLRYQVEKENEAENALSNMDEFHKKPQRAYGLQRKIRDYVGTNPVVYLTNEQLKDNNEKYKIKVIRRTEAYNGFMGSQNIKKCFASLRKGGTSCENLNKVCNQDFSITKRGKQLNKSMSVFGKKKFMYSSCGKGAFTYM